VASTAVEDYLKAIFKLAERSAGRAVTTSEIADRLGIARASVTAMLKRLKEDGLIDYVRYHGASLTPAGRAVAIDMIRRHRVIETFLVRDLDVALSDVDAEAEILEHAFSSDLIDRLWRHLGEPDFDPHGAPIPAPQHAPVETRALIPVAELPFGHAATVVRLSAHDKTELRELTQLGLKPGQGITRLANPTGDSVTLQVGQRRRELSRAMAEAVQVLDVDTPETGA